MNKTEIDFITDSVDADDDDCSLTITDQEIRTKDGTYYSEIYSVWTDENDQTKIKGHALNGAVIIEVYWDVGENIWIQEGTEYILAHNKTVGKWWKYGGYNLEEYQLREGK